MFQAMSSVDPSLRFPRDFFLRPALQVAPQLLGCLLASREGDVLVGGLITEVEAYEDENDPASHAFGGPKARNQPMFEQVGRAYIYFIYGNHFCFNVVCHRPGRAGAVLVRGLSPTAGQSTMLERRKRVPLTNGPGKLCQALALDIRHNRVDLTEPDGPIVLAPAGLQPQSVISSPRIGISKAQELPWRFWAEF